MGCCQSSKAGSSSQNNVEALKVETNICVQALESLIDFLVNNPLNCSPYIEAMILYFSKIDNIISKDFQEPLMERGTADSSKDLKCVQIFRQNIESLTQEIKGVFGKHQSEDDEEKKKKIEADLEGMTMKIYQFSVYIKDLSTKNLNVYFPSYEANAKGLASYDFVHGYDKLLTRLKKIAEDLKKKEEFESIIAAEFWVKNFPSSNEVDFDEFFEKFKLFCEQINKVSLSSAEYSKIQFEVGGNKSINKKQWDEFYRKKWVLWSQRKELLK